MATVNRGDFVLGLQPYDRMPNDYLRMVARVFAAYREIPLERSIVAYIDGYNLNLNSVVGNIVTVGITHGTAFVDDQFVGFKDSSELVINGDELAVDVSYSIVLYYQWINIIPPQEPTYNIVKSDRVNPEHMLELGKLYKRADGSWDLIDDKTPWWSDLLEKMTGDTEIDGPELLPYIPFIKENETEDIGWALDFHHHVGNNVDYNVRLRTDRVNDDRLFINDDRILTVADFDPSLQKIIYYLGRFATAPTARLDSTSLQEGDVYYNTTDHKYFYWKVSYWADIGSGSGGGGGSTAVVHNCEIIATAGQTTFNCNYNPDFLYVSLGGLDLASSEYVATNGSIIELNIPAQEGEVLKIFSISEIPVENLALTDLSDVDINNVQPDQVIAWDDTLNQWINKDANFGGGSGGRLTNCEFVAAAGQTQFSCPHDSAWVHVSVSGLSMPGSSYVADGSTITFNEPLEKNDIVKIFSALNGGLNDPISCEFIASDGQTTFNCTHNTAWVCVFVSGIGVPNANYTANGTTIVFNDPLEENDVVQIVSIMDTEGENELSSCEFIATDGQTQFPCTHNPSWVCVSVAGLDLPNDKFTADGNIITLVNPANEDEVVKVYSAKSSSSTTYDLEDLGDVTITNAQDGQSLVYDATNDIWINSTVSGGGSGFGMTNWCEFAATAGQTTFNCEYDPNFVYVSVAGIELAKDTYTATDGTSVVLDNAANENDVVIVRGIYTIGKLEITSPADGQVLVYEAATDTWKNANQTGEIHEHNFDATSGQTDFVITGGVYTRAAVYTNGVRNRNTEFTIFDNGSDTTIRFNSSRAENDWILIEVQDPSN